MYKINRIITRILAFIALCISCAWFYSEDSLESALTTVVLLSAFISTLFFDERQKKEKVLSQNLADQSIDTIQTGGDATVTQNKGIQSGGDVSINIRSLDKKEKSCIGDKQNQNVVSENTAIQAGGDVTLIQNKGCSATEIKELCQLFLRDNFPDLKDEVFKIVNNDVKKFADLLEQEIFKKWDVIVLGKFNHPDVQAAIKDAVQQASVREGEKANITVLVSLIVERASGSINDIQESSKKEGVVETSDELKAVKENPKVDWMQSPDATYVALAILIGAWQDKSQYDLDMIERLLGISYDEWLKKAREILHYPDSPLSLKNGTWNVVNRTEFWEQLGVHIFDQNIDTFKLVALSVLKEPDPAFEMPAEERYMASIHGKVTKCSRVLRQGIAEGLAILGAQPNVCSKCSQGKIEATCWSVIHNLLTDADHVLWGSLNELLPTLAEVDPDEFLDGVEKAMRMTPCPFKELFSQEGNSITGGNYLTGLLWALEGMAWDEKQLVRVCVVLGELASHDPGGQWANRPSNSLVTILMPWLPQTLASVDKRNVAVQTMFNECPDVAWNLLLQLLPNQNQISSRTHTPIWRKSILHDWKEGVTNDEYQQQISFYVELAVDKAGQNADRLSKLIGYFDKLPEPDLDKILLSLTSQLILDLPEEQRLSIWERLTRFTKRHQRFSYTEWALPNDIITRIEQVAEQIVPRSPFNLYQHLFSASDSDFYDDNKNWQEQEEQFNTKRENAISEIFQKNGVEGVIQFAETVPSPHHVGQALIVITDAVIERTLLPHFLDTPNDKHKALVSSFIRSNHFKKGWEWSDNIDKSVWESAQIGQFLAYLPFTNEVWERASEWLQGEESEYWTRAIVNAYQVNGDITIAIDKLIENDRPHAAINCLDRMCSSEQTVDTNQCIRALRAALLSREPSYDMDEHYTAELIKFLQTNSSVNQDDLCQVEWEYVPLLDYHGGIAPQTLERKLANDPKSFCDVIQLIYRSKKEERPYKEPTEESKAIATHAWRLLQGWKISPGTQKDDTFSEENFTEWLQNVKAACIESGHLEVALNNIGKALIYAPQDPKGLWIHCAVAKELNDRENDEMREGFRMGWYNSRGVHFVDPTGKPEKKLAEQFQNKADEVENAGFHRIASTLKDLAAGYDREAERIINDSKDRHDE